mgnify:CR=1 FL=1
MTQESISKLLLELAEPQCPPHRQIQIIDELVPKSTSLSTRTTKNILEEMIESNKRQHAPGLFTLLVRTQRETVEWDIYENLMKRYLEIARL